MAKPRSSTAVNCPECGKTISRKADLPRHLKIHMPDKEEKMQACPYEGCPYRTLQKSNLKTHLNVHTRERPHKCPTRGCQFRSGDPGSLSRHRKERHGYRPTGNSESCSPPRTRKTTSRQRRKVSPYPSSLLLANDHIGEGSKNTAAAYGTDLTIKHTQANDTQLAPPEDAPLVVSGSGVLSTSEAPVATIAQLPIPEQGVSYIFNTAAPSVSHMTANDGVFDDFYAQFDDWLVEATPGYTGSPLPTPPGQYTTDDTSSPLPASLSAGSWSIDTLMPTSLPVSTPSSVVSYMPNNSLSPTSTSLFAGLHEMPYAVDNLTVPQPASWNLPAYEVQPTVNSASSVYEHDGCATEASFEVQFDFWKPDSFAATDILLGAHPQPQVVYPRAVVNFDQSHLYANTVGTTYGGGETSDGYARWYMT